ncbi:uncharacterized protein LOC130648491 [Hydractinia symbiolongicarpus]|uniref:uncharacterized protein LOC130648491 n=1 Tax=Hydractinia symbiolongicarpus TaxID=13093 RepID=UPI00254A2BFA|nr:uncharacterized protein LOC130648491 [Hydractinia symbiolongicarpus]
MDKLAFTALVYILRIIPMFISLLGIYCLYQQKRRRDNQKLFLYALSTVEIIMGGFWITLRSLTLIVSSSTSVRRIIIAFYGSVNITFYLIMICITLDRLACVVLHIKYNYYITSTVVKKVIFICWIVGFACAIPLLATNEALSSKIIYVYGFTIADGIFVFTAVVTYTAIMLLLKHHRKTVEKMQNKNKNFRKQHLIPCLIVASFILFYCIPDTILTVKDKSENLLQIVTIFWSFGFISDPVIYIFLHKESRNIALNTLKCKIGSVSLGNSGCTERKQRKVSSMTVKTMETSEVFVMNTKSESNTIEKELKA